MAARNKEDKVSYEHEKYLILTNMS